MREACDDVIEVEVAERGVVLALPAHLVQQQVPAVHRRQQVLVLPAANTTNHIIRLGGNGEVLTRMQPAIEIKI